MLVGYHSLYLIAMPGSHLAFFIVIFKSAPHVDSHHDLSTLSASRANDFCIVSQSSQRYAMLNIWHGSSQRIDIRLTKAEGQHPAQKNSRSCNKAHCWPPCVCSEQRFRWASLNEINKKTKHLLAVIPSSESLVLADLQVLWLHITDQTNQTMILISDCWGHRVWSSTGTWLPGLATADWLANQHNILPYLDTRTAVNATDQVNLMAMVPFFMLITWERQAKLC